MQKLFSEEYSFLEYHDRLAEAKLHYILDRSVRTFICYIDCLTLKGHLAYSMVCTISPVRISLFTIFQSIVSKLNIAEMLVFLFNRREGEMPWPTNEANHCAELDKKVMQSNVVLV